MELHYLGLLPIIFLLVLRYARDNSNRTDWQNLFSDFIISIMIWLSILSFAWFLKATIEQAQAVTTTATVEPNDINTCVEILKANGYLK